MKKHYLSLSLLAAAAGMTLATSGHAQSVDALLDKLVDKGVLSVNEANGLREESDKGFNTAISAKLGMPDWVSSLKINGDIRTRYERFSAVNNPKDGAGNSQFTDRNRFRYRLRFGIVANMSDDFEAGFRLTSDEQTGGSTGNAGAFGGDPLSGNATMQDNGSKKFIFIDQVYGKWSPLKGPDLNGNLIVGKMENPFVFSDMVFDPDYTPEGAATQLAYQIGTKHSIKANVGVFVLDEIGTTGLDPFMNIEQIRWDAAWTPKFSTSVGVANLLITHYESLDNASVPNGQRGNTRRLAPGGLAIPAYGFNTLQGDASATYLLDSMPFNSGPFPVKVGGDYMINEQAPGSDGNYAYSFGVTLGKSGKKNTWDLSYTWKYLGANAWYEELVDSDFGAFYQGANSPANSGSNAGYGSGTNVKGHIIKFSYSPSDSLTLSGKLFLTELIHPFPMISGSDMTRVQVDAQWKF